MLIMLVLRGQRARIPILKNGENVSYFSNVGKFLTLIGYPSQSDIPHPPKHIKFTLRPLPWFYDTPLPPFFTLSLFVCLFLI